MVLWIRDENKVTPLQSDPHARVWAVVVAAVVAYHGRRFFRWAEKRGAAIKATGGTR
jgi:hypothetical protein